YCRPFVVGEGDNRAFTGVVSLVAARRGDPAAEQKAAVLAEQADQPAGFGAEARGLNSAGVSENLHAGNFGRLTEQRRFIPIVAANAFGDDGQYINAEFAGSARHDPSELSDAGPRAGTHRVDGHDERWPVMVPSDGCVCWPGRGDMVRRAGRLVINP